MNTAFVLLFLVVFVATAYGNPFESTHMVTMRKAELMEIVDCISKSKDPKLCEKFEGCEKLMPQQVFIASTKCKKECILGGLKKCTELAPLFQTLEVPLKIFDCIVKNTHKLNAEESKQMVEFEKCARDLHVSSCKFPKHIEEFHKVDRN